MCYKTSRQRRTVKTAPQGIKIRGSKGFTPAPRVSAPFIAPTVTEFKFEMLAPNHPRRVLSAATLECAIEGAKIYTMLDDSPQFSLSLNGSLLKAELTQGLWNFTRVR